MDQRIVQYYLLCSITTKGKLHVVNTLRAEELNKLLTRVQQKILLRDDNGLMVNETVIGGNDNNNCIVIN